MMAHTLAFLQNAYTSSEEAAKDIESMYALDGVPPDSDFDYLERALQRFRCRGLFGGRNQTGLRILKAFGAADINSIWFENASPKWGWLSTHKFPADHDHMRARIELVKPRVILTFGLYATHAMHQIAGDWKHIEGPHPAARFRDIRQRLDAMAQQWRDALEVVHV
jgi:hypothetical protein